MEELFELTTTCHPQAFNMEELHEGHGDML